MKPASKASTLIIAKDAKDRDVSAEKELKIKNNTI
jgi:hypothetical protein